MSHLQHHQSLINNLVVILIVHITFSSLPRRSEHYANTERLVVKSSSMRHVEGGWPKDVDFTEQSDVSRFRKKVEKDEEYKGAIKALGPIVARCLKQNTTINIYEVGKEIATLLLKESL